MIDIRQAVKVREMLDEDFHIGILIHHHLLPAGTVVLFRDIDKVRGVCIIETPINDEWIERNIKSGNGIRTINTCVGFPLKQIEEILI